MSTFGNVAGGTVNATDNLGGGLSIEKYTLSENGYVTKIGCGFADPNVGTPDVHFYGVIYQDVAGSPGILMGKTQISDAIIKGVSAHYNYGYFADGLYLLAGDYWIGAIIESSASGYAIFTDGTGTTQSIGQINAYPTPPDPAPVSLVSHTWTSYQYADYTPAANWNIPLRTTQGYLNNKAGTVGLSKKQALSVLAGTSADEPMNRQDAANIYAGTTALTTEQALKNKVSLLGNVDITGQEATRRL